MKKKFPFQSVISPLTGFIVCILIILFCAQNPLSALASLFTGTFTSPYYFGSMLNTAAFLMLAGTGASLSLKAGNMNLGGEGQIYTGGFVAALVLTSSWKIPSWLFGSDEPFQMMGLTSPARRFRQNRKTVLIFP